MSAKQGILDRTVVSHSPMLLTTPWTSRFLGEVNSIAWLNASFYEGAEDRYDDLPDPIVFNVTLLAPIECQGVCTDYQATYGPLHGSANATQLSVSQHAPPGNYSFQASFYVAAKDTDVVLGASQPFSLQVPPASAPLKPTSQSNKASAAATPSTLAILALAVCLYAVYL